MRDALQARLLQDIPDLLVIGGDTLRAPHILTVAIAGADSETLLMHLDMQGICASGGSACSTGAVEPSHVLSAMGIARETAVGQVRFSFGHESTPADGERVASVLPKVAQRARKLAGSLGRS
jgi:cysteine desulfurase